MSNRENSNEKASAPETREQSATCYCEYCKCNRSFVFDCIDYKGNERHRCLACGNTYKSTATPQPDKAAQESPLDALKRQYDWTSREATWLLQVEEQLDAGNEALKFIGPLKQEVEYLAAELERVKQQRDEALSRFGELIAITDELLAALKRSLNWLTSYPGNGADKVADQAREAISKAEANQ